MGSVASVDSSYPAGHVRTGSVLMFVDTAKVELPLPVIFVQLLPYMVTQLLNESHGYDPANCPGCAMKQEAIRAMDQALSENGWGLQGAPRKMVDDILNGVLPPLDEADATP